MTRTRDFRLDRRTYPRCELRDLLAFKVWHQPMVFMRRLMPEKPGYLRAYFDPILDHEHWILPGFDKARPLKLVACCSGVSW